MEYYTSDSSESENNKIIDLNHLMLNTKLIEQNLEGFINEEKKIIQDVEVLLLEHNCLDAFPEIIYKFVNVNTLDLSNCGLSILPDVFKYCPLTTLIVKNNNLTNESLPKTFTHSDKVRELNLSGNLLTAFPEQLVSFPQVKYLYLAGNKISVVSNNIGRLRSLRILSLGGNEITALPLSIGRLSTLQALVLCDNKIRTLPANIANLKQLKSLLLHKNCLRTLPPAIIGLENLTELSLRDNPLVVRFVSDMAHNPGSLLELSARTIKIHNIEAKSGDIPLVLVNYLDNSHRCVNPQCKGVFFDNRVEHIKFVDFCGKYRLPLLQYLCSSKCIDDQEEEVSMSGSYMMKKVLLG